MRIKCPYCGERALEEFTYSGDATVTRPGSLDASATDAWVDYVYFRDNPAGPRDRGVAAIGELFQRSLTAIRTFDPHGLASASSPQWRFGWAPMPFSSMTRPSANRSR